MIKLFCFITESAAEWQQKSSEWKEQHSKYYGVYQMTLLVKRQALHQNFKNLQLLIINMKWLIKGGWPNFSYRVIDLPWKHVPSPKMSNNKF